MLPLVPAPLPTRLAHYYAKFVTEYAKHGADIQYLSLFNEPIDSYTVITDNEMANLLGNHVGPVPPLRLGPWLLGRAASCWLLGVGRWALVGRGPWATEFPRPDARCT